VDIPCSDDKLPRTNKSLFKSLRMRGRRAKRKGSAARTVILAHMEIPVATTPLLVIKLEIAVHMPMSGDIVRTCSAGVQRAVRRIL
jgi:hypothetical protein